MEATSPCPFRYIHKGRTFCAIAIRDRRYTTSEVEPAACKSCKARRAVAGVACGHLELGVEVDQYGGTLSVDIFYASCAKLMERIMELGNCGEGKCEHWVPVSDERFATMRAEAVAAQKELEAKTSA
jgi:hypothetical protein